MQVKVVARILAPIVFLFMSMFPPESIDSKSWYVLALGIWMLLWWLTETVHLAVTALLPMVILPIMGVMPLKAITPSYANPLVYLFFGGFILALAIEKWNLHKRIALKIISITGTGTMRIFLGFMLATYFLSMWISNTATTVMMMPIALSVIDLMDREKKTNLAVLMLIGVAWSANIGGMATLIGTPPNLVLAGFMKEELGREIFFSQWLAFGLPLSSVLLFLAYVLLGWLMPRAQREKSGLGANDLIDKELKALGKMEKAEKRVLIVFVVTALAWIFRQQIVAFTGIKEISDTVIALVAGLLLFVIPASGEERSEPLLTWRDTRNLEWGILVLFGGGLALAGAIQESTWVTRLSATIGEMDLSSLILLIGLIAIMGVFLTEVISNMALVTALLPLMVALAVGSNTDFFDLALPLTLGASCAFMLPMATPPNAIVFSSGRITVATMARYGFVMNIISILCIVALSYVLAG